MQFWQRCFCVRGSVPGVAGFIILDEESVEPWTVYKQPVKQWRKNEGDGWLELSWGGFYFRGAAIMAPYWFWLLILTALAIAPWIRQLKWRFSLRTLLIATTLVAVVLGLVVAFR